MSFDLMVDHTVGIDQTSTQKIIEIFCLIFLTSWNVSDLKGNFFYFFLAGVVSSEIK